MDILAKDVRSIWIKRPLRIDQARTHMEMSGVTVDCCIQRDGSSKWAIRSGDSECLGKDGEWIHEPIPSSRDEEFYRMYRWDLMAEAIAFARENAV